jgi:hypothetical protein
MSQSNLFSNFTPKRFSSTHGIANKGFSGLQRFVSRKKIGTA